MKLLVEGHHLEARWIGPSAEQAPTLVFLHEGLGSIAQWRDFPDRLAGATGCGALVYARLGYGRSDPVTLPRPLDYMQDEGRRVLPAVLAAAGVRDPILFGHSDGGSIALLHAAAFPRRVAGAIVCAPHILVEDLSVASIAQARQAYLGTDLRERLAKYHDDPDSAFWGWNDIWLHPPFRDWTIVHELGAIACPLLAVQGLDDEYGTLAQIRGIAERVPRTELLELPACGHSPHRDQPERLIAAVQAFVQKSS